MDCCNKTNKKKWVGKELSMLQSENRDTLNRLDEFLHIIQQKDLLIEQLQTKEKVICKQNRKLHKELSEVIKTNKHMIKKVAAYRHRLSALPPTVNIIEEEQE